MNARVVSLGVLIIILAGLAYYFGYGDSQPSLAQNPTSTSQTTGTGGEAGVYSAVDPAMTGTWRSKEDSKFTREFRADGTVVDRYQGDASATATGTYVTVDPAIVAVPGISADYLSGMTVLRITWEDDTAPMFFSINSMTESDLSMTNLSGRGNILMFTKVN